MYSSLSMNSTYPPNSSTSLTRTSRIQLRSYPVIITQKLHAYSTTAAPTHSQHFERFPPFDTSTQPTAGYFLPATIRRLIRTTFFGSSNRFKWTRMSPLLTPWLDSTEPQLKSPMCMRRDDTFARTFFENLTENGSWEGGSCSSRTIDLTTIVGISMAYNCEEWLW